MFVISLTYSKPLDEIDAVMREHVAFLEKCYEAGLFVASGRKVPRTGGVILAMGATREELERVMALDPFVRDGLAVFEVIEFRTSQHHPDFAAFADAGTRAVRRPGS